MHPSPPPPPSAGRGVELPPKFSKGRGAWQDLNFKRRVAGKEGVTFFSGEGVRIFTYIKNKLKSGIFYDKKFISKIFFSATNKNSDCKILTKKLVIYF